MFIVRYIPLSILLSFCFGQILLNESFDNPDGLPAGWEFIPDSYPTLTGQWLISSNSSGFNINAPSATYFWSPSVPNSFAYAYEGHYMYSPIIYVDSLTNAMISFLIAFDGYQSPAGHFNGINFEYSSDGDEWVTALNYVISADGETVDIYPRVETFYASMETTLQLRWETYGTNSYYIDAWHIDDVDVSVRECLTYINDQDVLEDETLKFFLETDTCSTDSIAFASNSINSNIATSISNDSLLIVPAADWYGSSQINVFAISNEDTLDNKSFIVNVLSVNDEGPVIDSIPDYLISEDTSLVIILSAYDYDGDVIFFEASASDSSIHLTIVDSFLTINPAENWNGESEISVFASDGYLTDSSSFYFSVDPVNDPPADFDLISPENQSVVYNLNPTLRWDIPIDPDDRSRSIVSYDIYLDTDLTNTTPNTVTTNSYTVEADLIEDMLYFWKVVAVDDEGATRESPTWTFTTNSQNSPPSAFVLVEPENNSTLNIFNPLFCWEESFDSDYGSTIDYKIFLGEDLDSMNIIYQGPYLESCFNDTIGLVNDNTIYFWRVEAEDNVGATSTSDLFSFNINMENDSPSVSTLIAPLGNSIQTDLTPNFYWAEADDPDPMDHINYIMRWWHMGISPTMYSIDTDSNGYTPQEGLADNSQFLWNVVATDMYGLESSSDSLYFYTDSFPEPPTFFLTINPEDGSEGLPTSVEFVWSSSFDPDPLDQVNYQLVYALDWEDSSSYNYSELIQDTSIVMELVDNMEYQWKVLAIDNDGFVVGSNNDTPKSLVVGTLSIGSENIPSTFTLHQNYPNPFNPITTVRYELPEDSFTNITIYDMLGNVVNNLVNTNQSPGYKSIQWNATNNQGEPVSAGVYLYKIQAGDFVDTKKMILLK